MPDETLTLAAVLAKMDERLARQDDILAKMDERSVQMAAILERMDARSVQMDQRSVDMAALLTKMDERLARQDQILATIQESTERTAQYHARTAQMLAEHTLIMDRILERLPARTTP